MAIPAVIAEAAIAAAGPARAVSDAAAVIAGVEAALATDRRRWGQYLQARLGDLPPSATSLRELYMTLAEEFYAAADAIDSNEYHAVDRR